MASIQTQSTAAISLVGPSEETLTCEMRLPTLRHVLSLFFNQYNVLKYTVREVYMWNMLYITTMIERNAIEKLEKLFETWNKLKNSKRVTDTQTNDNAFQADIKKLFNIAHAHAMSSIATED